MLKKQSVSLETRTKLLNVNSAQLLSTNQALSEESRQLTEQIVNLTSRNLKIMQEHARLVQYTSEQHEEKFNMSQTIETLLSSNTRLEEETGRLSEVNSLLRGELFDVKDKNHKLVEINDQFQREIQKLGGEKKSEQSRQLQELQEQNQNLSVMLTAERQEAAQQQRKMERMVADSHPMNDACSSLDLYCPVVHQQTKGTSAVHLQP